MLKTISPRTTLFSLGLALLLSGLTACKGTPDKAADNKAAGTPATSATAPASPGAATSPAAPGMARSGTAAPGQPGATGQPGQLANQPAMPVEKIPAVVAKVNGREVKKAELMDGAQMVQMRLAQVGQPVTASADFYHHVLDELIAIILLQQDAKAQGITASDQEVQQLVAARKQNFPNEEAYKKALAQAGVTEEKLREQARDTIAVQKYVQTKIAPQATVSDQAAKDFYEKNKGQMQVPERAPSASHPRPRSIRRPLPPTARRPGRRRTGSSSACRAGRISPRWRRKPRTMPARRSGAATSAWSPKARTAAGVRGCRLRAQEAERSEPGGRKQLRLPDHPARRASGAVHGALRAGEGADRADAQAAADPEAIPGAGGSAAGQGEGADVYLRRVQPPSPARA